MSDIFKEYKGFDISKIKPNDFVQIVDREESNTERGKYNFTGNFLVSKISPSEITIINSNGTLVDLSVDYFTNIFWNPPCTRMDLKLIQ